MKYKIKEWQVLCYRAISPCVLVPDVGNWRRINNNNITQNMKLNTVKTVLVNATAGPDDIADCNLPAIFVKRNLSQKVKFNSLASV